MSSCGCDYCQARTCDVHVHYSHFLAKKAVRRRCQRAADRRRAGRIRGAAERQRRNETRRLSRKLNVREAA